MTDILVVNHGLHHVCGVHDIGRRLFDAIPDNVSKMYAEEAQQTVEACREFVPRVVLVNYRPDLMPWIPETIRDLPCDLKVAVAHNYDSHTLAALHTRHLADGFHVTLALEPKLFDLPGVIWSGRPLPPVSQWRGRPLNSLPVIGSFGFAFGHKRFDLVARETVALNRSAIFRLHCPTAHFGGSTDQTDAVLASVRAELADSLVDLSASLDHKPAQEVVNMLGACDVNCLLYDPGQPNAGLSSALDYLLAAGRPILVSEAAMFRHALPAAAVWPETSLADVLADADHHAVAVRERAGQLAQGYVDGIKQLLEMA